MNRTIKDTENARYAAPRFRITTWPAVLAAPPEVAVPRLVAWCQRLKEVEGSAARVLVPNLPRQEPASLPRAVGVREEAGDLRVYAGRQDSDGHYFSPESFAAMGSHSNMMLWDVAFAIRSDMARTLITGDELSEHRRRWQREPEDDLLGRLSQYVADLGDCSVWARNIVTAEDLPDELFMREFLALDASDDDALLTFLEAWGPLDWPEWSRDVMSITPPDELVRTDGGKAEVPLFGVVDPEIVFEWLTFLQGDILKLFETTETDAWQPHFVSSIEGNCDDFGVVIDPSPLRLQKSLVRLYQALFETWILLVNGDYQRTQFDEFGLPKDLVEPWSRRELSEPRGWSDFVQGLTHLLNSSANNYAPRVEVDLGNVDRVQDRSQVIGRPYPRITAALCLQALRFIADGVPARRCENEACGRWFVRQQGRSEYEQRRTTGVIYCSSSCARAQAQRQYRRRRRKTA